MLQDVGGYFISSFLNLAHKKLQMEMILCNRICASGIKGAHIGIIGTLGLLIIQIIPFLCFPVLFSGAQPIPFLDPPLISSVNKFGLNEGLVTNCLNEAFFDHKGRLWLNPCKNTAESLELSFFQFDGRQSTSYDLRPEWLTQETSKPLWFVCGETTSGFLFGVDHRERSNIFCWHPDNREQYFYALKEGTQLLNLVSDEQGSVLVLTVNNDTYQVFRLFEGSKKLVGSIKLDFKDDNKGTFPYPFEVKNQKAWFFHQRSGLVEIDLTNGNAHYQAWSEMANQPILEYSRFDYFNGKFEWKLIAVNNDELLLYLGEYNGFFTFNSRTNTLSPKPGLNQIMLKEGQRDKMLKVYFSRDKKGKLLTVSGYFYPYLATSGVTNFQALLIDHRGKWYDYKEILRQINPNPEFDVQEPPGKYFSNDFHRALGWTSTDELTILSLQPDLGVAAFKSEVGTRAIVIPDSLNLIINTDIRSTRLDLSNGRYTHLMEKDMYVNGMSPFYISRDQKVWMSLLHGGLLWYDLIHHQHDTIRIDVAFDKFIFLNEEEVALFSLSGELHIYNLKQRERRPYIHEKRPFSVGGKVNELLISKDGQLWVGAQGGLWQIDLKKDRIKHYDRFDDLSDVNILCLHEGEEGDLWLGTARSGVLIFNPNTGKIRQISEVNGLSNNTVVGILADDHLNRWVATYHKITVMTRDGEVLFDLGQVNGLTDDECNRTSYTKLPDGRMVFGGIDGVNILDPNHILKMFAEREPVHIYLTRLEYYSIKEKGNIVYQGSFNQTEPIQIPAAYRYISLDFAISEYTDLQNHTYAYRLIPTIHTKEQADAIPWSTLGSTSEITINNLQAGDYIVQIRGMDQNANQVVEPLEIAIQVKEFFYRTWWFYLLCAMPFVLSAWIWIQRIRTERKRLENEVERRTAQIQKDKAVIERQAVQLQELDQAKSRFFTNISHEFRTPLTVILGMVEQIKDSERARKLIRRNANHLLELVNQILNLRKLESGSLPTQFVQGDVVAYLHYIIESFHSLVEGKKIALTFETPHDQLVLDYDPEKLLHIVSNLLTNAVKYTPEGGAIHVSLETRMDQDAPAYQISVSDTGVGIPADKLSHIFDRFYQVDDELSRTGDGTGIGLTLVRELVNLLNGNIGVESKPGQGTTFTVQLPLTNQAALETSTPDAGVSAVMSTDTWSVDPMPRTKHGHTGLPTLLIVEDNRDVTEYLVTCLEEEYQLLFAADGQEGIEKAMEQVPDIIISDVMMPKVDGFTLCNTLKKDLRTSHIPIVLLTAKADPDSRITGLQRGADAYLAKPFDKRELKVRLQNLLTLRQRLQERYVSLEKLEPTDDPAIQQEDEFIIRIRQTILENMADEGFGVPELGKKIFMSRSQLHNKIKSLTDKSPSHLIRFVRMEKASQLLRESDLSVSLIAFEVGVNSLPYFSKIFTIEIGISPNKYREKFRSGQ